MTAEVGPNHLNELRSQIYRARAEYWYRKATTYGKVIGEAKVEAKGLVQKLKSPGELSYGDVATGLVCGLQIYGAFCVGEVLGRGNLVGYKMPGADHH